MTSTQQEETLKAIAEVLEAADFPRRHNTRQTGYCILALLDKTPRKGLLQGKTCLNDGARIHDILEFVRKTFRIKIAENTRETYRKTSLKQLLDHGLITRVQSSTNDPNTHYILNREFEKTLRSYIAASSQRRTQILSLLRKPKRILETTNERVVRITIANNIIKLSPGRHNQLIKQIIEVFASAFVDDPEVLYVSDTAHKIKYLSPTVKELGISIDEHAKAPDVILYSKSKNIVYIIEAVISSGVFSPDRIQDVEKVLFGNREKRFGVEYFTAFPDRAIFRKFVEDIAWGTQVWLAQEPFGVIIFKGD
ncbi:MAG: BsuBI/PstI family type II restriction endonuclease [Candidatus Caldarchaeum sp.]